jgi:predicted PurR-regulated permease PerM
MADLRDDSSVRQVAYILLTLAIIIVGLVYGRPFLVPIAIAALITVLIAAGADRLKRLWIPEPLATLGAILVLAAIIAGVFNILASQADSVAQVWPAYIQRLNAMTDQLLRWAGPRIASKINEAIANLDLTRQIPGLLGSAGGFVVGVALVTIYVGFLLFERSRMAGKIGLLFSSSEHAGEMQRAVTDIIESIRRYVWIKTIMSLLTSGVSYGVLRAIGVDFAETWALIIFLLNYIPSVGAIIGVLFPALVALVQFDTFLPFIVVAALLAAAQIIIGNIIEPSLMGRTLNLSPFVVMASLAFWAMIWGVVGAFLSVPLTTALIIVCSHIPSLRWIAILLSADSRSALGAISVRGGEVGVRYLEGGG